METQRGVCSGLPRDARQAVARRGQEAGTRPSLVGRGDGCLHGRIAIVAMLKQCEFAVLMETAGASLQTGNITEVAHRVGLLPISLEYIGSLLCGSVQTFADFLRSLKHMNGLRSVLYGKPLNSSMSLIGVYPTCRLENASVACPSQISVCPQSRIGRYAAALRRPSARSCWASWPSCPPLTSLWRSSPASRRPCTISPSR
jgi:hypothetical protein